MTCIPSASTRIPSADPPVRARRARLRLVSVVPALGALAAGAAVAGPAGASGSSNGVASGTPSSIIQTGLAAVKAASSVTVAGHLTLLGESISFHVSDTKSGDGSGSIGVSGITLDVRKVGSTIYVKGNTAALSKMGGSAAAKYAGKWLKASASTANISTFSKFLSTQTLLGQASIGTTGLALTKSGTTTVAGQPAVVITGQASTSEHKGTGRFLVATTGKPYLLSVTASIKASGLSTSLALTFSGFGRSDAVTAPSGAVSLSSVVGTSSSS